MDLLGAIKTRRSVRKYKPDPVEEEKLLTVLEAARWAPSWANTQCWEFIVIKDPETKRKLAEILLPRNPATEALRSAPIVLVACIRRGLSGVYRGLVVNEGFSMFDMGLALQNLTLAAHSLGLGTVHVGAFDVEKAAEIVGVPKEVSVVELMPLGYPSEVPKAPRRKELGEFVHREKYGQKI